MKRWELLLLLSWVGICISFEGAKKKAARTAFFDGEHEGFLEGLDQGKREERFRRNQKRRQRRKLNKGGHHGPQEESQEKGAQEDQGEAASA